MASTSISQSGFSAQSSPQAYKKKKTIFKSLTKWLKEVWKEALADACTRWPVPFLVLWFAILFAILVKLGLFLYPPSTACRPDGTFSPYTGYSYWDTAGFFQITLAFGSFTFTKVKVIDTVWDIVIGRVGQGILAYFSWRTFADYATVSMETTPMTYATFTILFMEGGPTFTSICQLVRDFVLYRRLESKTATTWVLLSMLFVLAWPTLIAAMSGYSPKTGAYIQDVNGSFVPYNEFQLLGYIIRDGTRINLAINYPVPAATKPSQASDNILLWKSDITLSPSRHLFSWNEGASCYRDEFQNEEDLNLCYLNSNVTNYVLKYGFNGRHANTSQWLNYTLPSHALDIRPVVVPYDLLSALNIKQKPQPAWAYANHIYTLLDVQDNGACQALGQSFQWGFSSLQLLIVVLLLTIWTSGTCLLWHKTHRFPPLPGQPERPRGLRALLLFVETVKSELEANAINPHILTHKQLKGHIYKSLKAGSMSFGFPLRKKIIHSRGVFQWVKENLVWLVIAITLSGVAIWMGSTLLGFLSLGIFLAYFTGTTSKSRLFLAAFLFLIAAILLPSGYTGGLRLLFAGSEGRVVY
ncbi:hypothetical protein F5B21DRAFT_467523 [Xylaria acuta]|nr:hypothetical protein F5B21DRAFT_467523 [Xylaria acuta]